MSTGNFLFYCLILIGPGVAISSSNWVICWVGIELSFLGLIPLLVRDGKGLPMLRRESTLKYFCIQAAGSGLLMFGGIIKFMMPLYMGSFGSNLIFLCGLRLKLGIFPFHFWVPGVVSGLGWYSMFLILTWQKIAPFILLMNLLSTSSDLHGLVFSLGGIRAIVGARIGLNQTKIAPILGASSITHRGWVAIGAVCGRFWVYFIIYCLSLGLLFIFLSKDLEFSSRLIVLSLRGLPPFVIFLGKWRVLKAALGLRSYWWFVGLPLFGSIMRLFFYLKFFYSFYLESNETLNFKLAAGGSSLMLTFLGALLIVNF